ncbi:DNA-directed RNA polymerase subunit Rpb5 [Tetraselmis virus 1]|uniref:DNA-directed RNA polymerase subunit Rpb5 n=1 Tax=Tetraselmis virus 1 TaxID=2060617 RepID=A0A2P0VMR7_9VIRU|nr:DNA-directed RNA polymerase subunit Rpb5 [Tetraselmis virus 1]AUF82170.1 DNA-directed RNA polymerase subunit Rpb5 [Tetraselmis virus 1]
MEIEDQVVKAWRTSREMLKDRGLDVTENVGDLEVASMAKEAFTFGLEIAPTVYVVFHTSLQSVKKQDVFSSAEGASHIVLILNTKNTIGGSSKPNNATVKSQYTEAEARGVNIEIFTLKEMQYNVSKHVLVPEHKHIKGDTNVSDVLKQLCVKNRYLLPAISPEDPMARYLGLKIGDVIKVKRPSMTSGISIAYRCCRKVKT